MKSDVRTRPKGHVDMKQFSNRATRLMDTSPGSYDQAAHTVEMTLSEGTPVKRFYGVEQLSMNEDAVVIDRIRTAGIPFLDSHNIYGIDSVLGRLEDVWFEGGALRGRVKFADTEAGRNAEGMVSRGEIRGISIGYRVDEWEIKDSDGNIKDPEKDRIGWDEELTFTGVRWELLEASLVSVPADPSASVRSLASMEDLRKTPHGREASEITVRVGDRSVTYRYGADGIQPRVVPASNKDGKTMPKITRSEDDTDEKKLAAEKEAERKRKARADKEAEDDDARADDDVEADRADGDDDAKDKDDKDKGRSAPVARVRGLAPVLTRSAMAELVRIGDQARDLGIALDIPDAIERNVTPDGLRKRMFEELAKKSKETGPRGSANGDRASVEVLRDERQGVAQAMEVALTTRILASRGRDGIKYEPKNDVERKAAEASADQARQYMGMGFVEIAAECIGHRGNIRSFATATDIITRAFQSTSDFPNIFQNVLNKSLLARYELATPTYRSLAVERPFRDFRPHPQIRAGDFPTLQPVTQAGELKAGTSNDNAENISVLPYGVIFPISRQMIVNDEMGAIDQILGSAGDSVMVFENTTFFTMMLSNPVLNQDSTAVFAAGHNNLASPGAAPSITTIATGRQNMRAQKSIGGLYLNVPPRIILTGPAQETAADQMVASITPTLVASYNPFSGKLTSVSDANITDDSWYLMADPARVPNFIYGFLNGANGPRVRTYEPFGLQGVQISLEHDFGVGAVDFRGAYKSPAY